MRYNVRVVGSFNPRGGRCAPLTFFSDWGSRGFQPMASFLHPVRGAVESFASVPAERELEAVQ